MKKVTISVVPNTMQRKTLDVTFDQLDTTQKEWDGMTQEEKSKLIDSSVEGLFLEYAKNVCHVRTY